jgi:hypothetical protein
LEYKTGSSKHFSEFNNYADPFKPSKVDKFEEPKYNFSRTTNFDSSLLTPKSRKNRLSSYNYDLDYDSNKFSNYIDKTFGEYLKSNQKKKTNLNGNDQVNYINSRLPTGKIDSFGFL